MKFSIITIFPDLITTYTDESILGRAQVDGHISVSVYDPRDFTDDKHRSVDAPPYGGGPGMVMQAEPVLRAVEAARSESKVESRKSKVVVLSAQGRQFDKQMAKDTATDIEHLILICGRYEGIDRRVIEALAAEEVSVGPYILTGGELPALIMIDATARFVAGVLGNEESLEDERTAGTHVYTRPETLTYKGEEYTVPEVLMSGHHAEIEKWREAQAKNQE
ncbi:MAG: tRNA (guanosine(37)-N1)-methyltransferase TrmD [Candidatus Paceibacterota bacterium]